MTSNDEGLADGRAISVEQVRTLRQTRGLTSAGIEAIPEPTLARALRRLEYPDLPRARETYRQVQARDERGQYPAARRMLNAMRQLDSHPGTPSLGGVVAGVPTGTNVAPQRLGLTTGADGRARGRDWVPLGPGNIGGRTRSIVFHPDQPDTMWAASAGGGVWRTDDAGAQLAAWSTTSWRTSPSRPSPSTRPTPTCSTRAPARASSTSTRSAARGSSARPTASTWSQLPATLGARFADGQPDRPERDRDRSSSRPAPADCRAVPTRAARPGRRCCPARSRTSSSTRRTRTKAVAGSLRTARDGVVHHRRRPDLGRRRRTTIAVAGPGRADVRRRRPRHRLRVGRDQQRRRSGGPPTAARSFTAPASLNADGAAGVVPGGPGLVRQRHLGRRPDRRRPGRRRRRRPVAQHRRRRHRWTR